MPGPTKPSHGKCKRCEQTRPRFPYKPLHDCIAAAGNVDLIEARSWLEDIENSDDRWCTDRLDRTPRYLCVPCHDREAIEEQQFIDDHEL